MKLGIVIPFKSKRVSNNWQQTCEALQATLRSLANQSNQSYVVAVVGHECPDFLQAGLPQVLFESVDIAPPNRQAADFSHKHFIRDKSIKITKGVQRLKQEAVSHWYQLDADDLLHQDFVEQALQLDGVPGAIIDHGYFVYKKRQRVIETHELSQYCGSTSIILDQHMPTPSEVSEAGSQQVPWCRYPHMAMRRFFSEELNQAPAVLEQALVGYVLEHGDNISDAWRDDLIKATKAYLKPLLKGKRLNPLLKQQFSIG